MSSGRQIGWGQIGLGAAVAGMGLGLAWWGARPPQGSRQPRLPPSDPARPIVRSPSAPSTIAAGRRLNRASGILAASVLIDSALEHYRGTFFNPAMYTPILVSSLTLAVSAHGLADPRGGAHRLRDAIYGAAAATGTVGTAFHLYNIAIRRGGFYWQNLFYGAPLGAPAALALAGLLGVAAERVRDAPTGAAPAVFGMPAGRTTAALAAAGLLGATGEAGLLHFRGAFHDPFMYVPVTMPPIAAALTAGAALAPAGRLRRLARWWLRITAGLGLAGAGFHAYGVHRAMGGWRNPRQNVLNGPPLPAPPSFTGLALAGLAALDLMEERGDA